MYAIAELIDHVSWLFVAIMQYSPVVRGKTLILVWGRYVCVPVASDCAPAVVAESPALEPM
jgi:hypothetical protein